MKVLRALSSLGAILTTLALVACSTPQFHPVSNETVESEIGQDAFIMPDGYRLPMKQYWPSTEPKAIILALHGFNDYRKAFESMCKFMIEHQVACIAYDQRGFGETEYKGLWPQAGQHERDMMQIVKLLKDRYSDTPVYAAGESMGGAVILSASSQSHPFWQTNLEGSILFAPAVWARSTQPWYQRFGLWLAVHTFPDWKPTGESLEIVATDNNEALREMYYDENVIKETRIDAIYGLTNLMDRAFLVFDKQPTRTLVLYGEKDEVIPKLPTCKMLARTSELETPPQVILYPEGYHMLTRDLQAERVFGDIVTWLSSGSIEETDQARVDEFCDA